MALQDIISSILSSSIGSAFKDIVGSFKADPTVAAQLQERLAEKQLDLQGKIIDQVTAQIQVDLAEAQSKSLFVSGWRPLVGWVCGFAFAYDLVMRDWIIIILSVRHFDISKLPNPDLATMMPVLLGLLGMAGLRTYEKVQSAPGTAKLN